MMFSKGRRFFAVVAVAALCAVLVGGALNIHKAYGAAGAAIHGGNTDGIEAPFLKFFLKLNLSSAQKQQVASILKSYRQTVGSSVAAVVEAKKNLCDAVHSATYDENKVRAAAKNAASAQEELAVVRAQLAAQLQGVLSADQLAAVTQFRADMYSHIKDKLAGIHSIIDLWIASNGA
ncbi:MAG: periplasmic heavy metal sensor [Nitrospirae bacterium]|nr:periplasmic heavy metal sensor [Nitrospirota bacterium]